MKYLIGVVLLLLAALPGLAAEPVKLNYTMLEPGLAAVQESELDAVRSAVKLIKDGEHSLALARLTSLNQRTPQNSSLRILASYAFLQLGNLAGAFEEAEKAHAAPNGNAFTCWFLGKIALLNGKTAVCQREIEHVKKSGQMAAEVKDLEREMQKR
jgi:hypothetical protein